MGIGINKISGANQIYKANKVDSKKAVTEVVSTSNKKDQVQISKEAMDFQTVLKAVKQLNNLPDIREEIVGPIKEKLDNGSYSVDSNDLAKKILSGGFNRKV